MVQTRCDSTASLLVLKMPVGREGKFIISLRICVLNNCTLPKISHPVCHRAVLKLSIGNVSPSVWTCPCARLHPRPERNPNWSTFRTGRFADIPVSFLDTLFFLLFSPDSLLPRSQHVSGDPVPDGAWRFSRKFCNGLFNFTGDPTINDYSVI